MSLTLFSEKNNNNNNKEIVIVFHIWSDIKLMTLILSAHLETVLTVLT